MLNSLPFLIVVVPTVTALLCLIPASPRVAETASAVGALLLLIGSIMLAVLVSGSRPACLSTSIRSCVQAPGPIGIYVDSLSAFLVLVIGTVGSAVILYSRGYMRHEVRDGRMQRGELRWYYLWLHLFVAVMLVFVMLSNLGAMWVAMEITTVISGILVGFSRRPAAIEAAWKYVIICSLGIGLALFGTVLMYYAAFAIPSIGPGNGALDWVRLMHAAPQVNKELVRLSIVFILIGFGTKAGLAPMHTWLPDAHSQAPSPVSALLSAGLLNCAIYAILRYSALSTHFLGPDFSSHLLLIFGFLSIVTALPFILIQTDIKRLLAYSSVEHIGIIAVAVGIGGRVAVFAALLHILNHAVTKCSMFLSVGTLIQRFHTRNISRIGGALRTSSGLAVFVLLGGIALAGAPPFAPFLSEFTAARGAFSQGLGFAGVLLLILLAVAFAGLLIQVTHIALGPAVFRRRMSALSMRTGTQTLVTPSGIGVLAVTGIAVLVLGLHVPNTLVILLQQAEVVLNIGGQS